MSAGQQSADGGAALRLVPPWPALALPLLLVGAYGLQTPETPWSFGLSPAAVSDGRLSALLTSMWFHASWGHVLTNAVAGGALAWRVCRALGEGVRAGLAFWGLFLACGVAAGLGYVLLYPDSPDVLVGASGAVSGLLGAAARVSLRSDRPKPLFALTPAFFTLLFCLLNMVLAFRAEGIAWQAHLAGYLAGLLLAPAALKLAWAGRH